MVAPVHIFGREEFENMENRPDLRTITTAESFDVTEEERYEDHKFNFQDSRFVSDTIEVTDSMRVRGVLGALESYDGELQLPATLKPLQRIDKLLNQTVSIRGEKKTRSEWLPQEEVAGEILKELDEHNHPVAQALGQLRERYDHEQLNEFDYKQTVINTLKTTHERQFRDIYSEYISALRSQ